LVCGADASTPLPDPELVPLEEPELLPPPLEPALVPPLEPELLPLLDSFDDPPPPDELELLHAARTTEKAPK
jgi:hypothetical protein